MALKVGEKLRKREGGGGDRDWDIGLQGDVKVMLEGKPEFYIIESLEESNHNRWINLLEIIC